MESDGQVVEKLRSGLGKIAFLRVQSYALKVYEIHKNISDFIWRKSTKCDKIIWDFLFIFLGRNVKHEWKFRMAINKLLEKDEMHML